MKVRLATKQDNQAIRALSQLSPHTKWLSPPKSYPGSWAELWANPDMGVVGTSNQLVGFVYVRHDQGKCSKLKFMGVSPDHQREGLGSAMLQWALSRSPHPKLKLECDSTNKQALAFYKKHGGVLVGQRTFRNGVHAVTLEFDTPKSK